jgi:serine/threonine-protein kinase
MELMVEKGLPKTIGRYEIVREIGRGAMGVVYEGRDLSLMRPVALKTLLLEPLPEELREPFEKRFYQEARAAASLQHPCIVVVYEIGIDAAADAFFISLEFLRGRTLEDVIAEGPLPWRDAVRIAGRLADALSHAHEHGIVHRDMKPANVMILKKGEPKIMDFGVAKLETSKLTALGDVLGSPGYMAPEQALEARVDARSDLFSLGTVLYEALTGTRAFGSGTFSEILTRLAYDTPPPPSRRVKDIPQAVDAIVAHAMAKSPSERYPNADALVEDIEDALAGRPLRHTRVPPAKPGEASADAPTPDLPVKSPTARPPAIEGGTSTVPALDQTATPPRDLPRGPLVLPEGKRVSLRLLSGPQEGLEHVLAHASLLIGREGGNAGAGIELKESQVSRMHAMIEARGPRFVVRDLESKNGTFIGSLRVKEQEIEHGGEFLIGGTRFMLLVADV